MRADLLRFFWRNQRGNFAIVFSLAALPVVGIAGMALDYSRISAAQNKLQAAVDAGLLAAATKGGNKTSDMQMLAADFVEANMGETPVRTKTTVDSRHIRIEASHELKLPVLAAIGMPVIEIVVTGELTSAAALKSGGVAKLGASDARQRELWQRFDRVTRSLPHHERIRLRHKLEASLNSRGSGFYLSR